MPLDLTPLRNPIARLGKGLRRHLAEPTDQQPRDRLLQRFELTCEFSPKMVGRSLPQMLPIAEAAARMTVAEFGRAGDDRCRFRAEWPVWRLFRDIGTRTTHTYDADTASEVEEAGPLCGEVEKRIA